jgi:23S rRNA pseudouridine2605 synthase
MIEGGERIAKRIARAGVCSRRDAERLIADGRVKVDGVVLTSPALDVLPHQIILVDGAPLPAAEATRLWRYHKPDGLVTTHKDPDGRMTVFQALPPELPRVLSVGRLDLTSEGLLLLTNDGALARQLELPKTGWVRRYKVRIHGLIGQRMLEDLAHGITIEGVEYGPIIADLEQVRGTNAWATFQLKEGKNREIRKVVEHLGCRVTRLIRTAYGPFQLGLLERGQVEEVPTKVLREQLGAIYKIDLPPRVPAAKGVRGRSASPPPGLPPLTGGGAKAPAPKPRKTLTLSKPKPTENPSPRKRGEDGRGGPAADAPRARPKPPRPKRRQP